MAAATAANHVANHVGDGDTGPVHAVCEVLAGLFAILVRVGELLTPFGALPFCLLHVP